MFEQPPQEPNKKKKKTSLTRAALFAGAMASSFGAEGCDDNIPEPKKPGIVVSDKVEVKDEVEDLKPILIDDALFDVEVNHDITDLRGNLYLTLESYQSKLTGQKSKEKAKQEFISGINDARKNFWLDRMGSYHQQERYFSKVLDNISLRKKIRKLVEQECEGTVVPPELVSAVMALESKFDQSLSSGVAWGIGMVTPAMAVDGGAVPRNQLHDCWQEKMPYKNKKTGKTEMNMTKFEKRNPEKKEALIKRLQEDMGFNIKVMVGGLDFLINKFNGDLGVVLAIYNEGPRNIETTIIKLYNDWQSREYEKDLRARDGKKRNIQKPKAVSRGSIARTDSWSRIMHEANITFFDLYNQSKRGDGVDHYVFNVLAVSSTASNILFSDDPNFKADPIIDEGTTQDWIENKEAQKRRTARRTK